MDQCSMVQLKKEKDHRSTKSLKAPPLPIVRKIFNLPSIVCIAAQMPPTLIIRNDNSSIPYCYIYCAFLKLLSLLHNRAVLSCPLK